MSLILIFSLNYVWKFCLSLLPIIFRLSHSAIPICLFCNKVLKDLILCNFVCDNANYETNICRMTWLCQASDLSIFFYLLRKMIFNECTAIISWKSTGTLFYIDVTC